MSDFLKRLISGATGRAEHGGGRSAALHPEASVLLAAFLSEVGRAGLNQGRAAAIAAGRAIAESSLDVQHSLFMLLVERQGREGAYGGNAEWWAHYFAMRRLTSDLLRRPLPFDEASIAALLDHGNQADFFAFHLPRASIIGAVERYLQKDPLTPVLRHSLEQTLWRLRQKKEYAEDRKLARRVEALLGHTGAAPGNAIVPGDAWTDDALREIDQMAQEARGAWISLLGHALTATSTRPSAKWLRAAGALLDGVGKSDYSTRAARWLQRVGQPGSVVVELAPGHAATDRTLLHPGNSDALKGLVWCATLVSDEPLLRAIGSAADASFKKIANIGPRSVKLGNACLYTLSCSKADAAVTELVRLQARVKHPSSRKQVAAALERCAGQRGQTPEDLSELCVPTFGLSLPGVLRRVLGDIEARISIAGSSEPTVSWHTAHGKERTSAPKALRDADPKGVKEIAGIKKELERTLPAQRARLERLLLSERSWPLADWRARFLDHPLMHHMTTRLVWAAASRGLRVLFIPHRDALESARGEPLDALDDEATVRLWHPITSEPGEVAAWREALFRLQVRQPFKQAHREVYLLTDAEHRTETYSNRFAAHILGQHQMAALCRERGWSYRLQGDFDAGCPVPTLQLPAFNLVAEYLVEAILDRSDLSGAGISRHVTTDQVAFHRAGERDRLPLRSIPAIVFSEVMRDVDLFVGVTSVGNNPQWEDAGPQDRLGDYWRAYNAGELSESGIGRRDLLAALLPRLRIASVCSVQDKHLVVRGKLRTYKIHLASGNILMEPNSQYLCIVPGPPRGEKDVFLPFEGDRMLSVILSKAFMLAEDDKIEDETITRQIGRKA